MTKSIRGKGAVGVAISYYSLQGTISIPLVSSDYNLIFDDGNKLYRIKVISCSYKAPSGLYAACIRTSGGNQPNTKVKKFDNTSCDIVFIVTDSFDVYVIPSGEISSSRQISLDDNYAGFKVMFYSGLAQW
jgi:hypothetical protein